MNFLRRLIRGNRVERGGSSDHMILPFQPEWLPPQEFPDPIVAPEDMLGILEQSPATTSDSQRYGFPIEWTQDPGFGIVTDGELMTPGELHIEHLPNIAPFLFDDDPNNSLDHTLRRLTGHTASDCIRLRGWPITFGVVAHILLYEAQFGDGSKPAILSSTFQKKHLVIKLRVFQISG